MSSQRKASKFKNSFAILFSFKHPQTFSQTHRCICEDQTLSKMEEGSADFEDAFTRLSSKLSVMKVDLKTEIMTNNWLTWCLPED